MTNRLYREIVEIIHPQLTFRKISPNDYALVNAFDHTEYRLSFHSDTDEVSKDYCLINFFPNPHNPDTWVMLVAGLGTYGTWGGLEFTMTKPFLQHKAVRAGRPFEAVVEIEVGQFKPIPRLVAIYSTPKK